MTILKSAFKLPKISEEEVGYPIRQGIGKPHRIHRSKRNRFDLRKSEKSTKWLINKGKLPIKGKDSYPHILIDGE